ncbi:MAG TPA: phosphopentomutase [Myxococcota bacterium]|nr:phosphopentomutase [Myxococcota bacterium]
MKTVTTHQIRKLLWLVLDSVGIGALPDAHLYGDEGSNTLLHSALAVGDFRMPHLARLGLGHLVDVPGIPREPGPDGHFARLAERSPGKDTTTGHWEMAGLVMKGAFKAFTDTGFPPDVIAEFERRSGFKTIGNYSASGTDIIRDLGPEHERTGSLIVYTSADSVFQIAAHEDVVPLERLYSACMVAREILDAHNVARVIARPFVGSPGSYTRTYNRRDFSMTPPGPTVLDMLSGAGIPVVGVGKIHDIFAGRGVTESIHTEGNRDGLIQSIRQIRDLDRGLVFTNLVDFDMVWGHRRNAEGYAAGLMEADSFVPGLMEAVGPEGMLIVTADHGCDPTAAWSTDHTREYVPFLAWHHGIAPGSGRDVGPRTTFADIGATVAALFGVGPTVDGDPMDLS